MTDKTLQDAAQTILDATNEASNLDDIIQYAMDEAMETDGIEEWVFNFRAALKAISQEGSDE